MCGSVWVSSNSVAAQPVDVVALGGEWSLVACLHVTVSRARKSTLFAAGFRPVQGSGGSNASVGVFRRIIQLLMGQFWICGRALCRSIVVSGFVRELQQKAVIRVTPTYDMGSSRSATVHSDGGNGFGL